MLWTNIQQLLFLFSWGFCRTCCQIFPTNAELTRYTENAVLADTNYFIANSIGNRSSVYVFSPDLNLFLDTFFKLPKTSKITVAIGMEDDGAPFDIFRSMKFTMRQFLNDERLNKLFVQNYDLFGCNPITTICSDVTKEEVAAFEKKVFPLPIGLDLHTFAGKGDMNRQEFQQKFCKQRKVISKMQLQSQSFAEKDLAAVVAFECNFDDNLIYRVRGRSEVCKLAMQHNASGMIVHAAKKNEEGPLTFWTALRNNTFALAPFGRGLDTHRLWEILNLRSIPIVLTSPIDRLYINYPIVIVQSWAEVFKPGSLKAYKSDIVARFGPEPFTADVVHRLSLQYWVEEFQGRVSEAPL